MVLNVFIATKDIKPGAKSTKWLTKISPSFPERPKTPEASIKSIETKKSLTSFQKGLVTVLVQMIFKTLSNPRANQILRHSHPL